MYTSIVNNVSDVNYFCIVDNVSIVKYSDLPIKKKHKKKPAPTEMLNITSVKESVQGKTSTFYKILSLVIIAIGCNRYSLNVKPEVFFPTKFCRPNS